MITKCETCWKRKECKVYEYNGRFTSICKECENKKTISADRSCELYQNMKQYEIVGLPIGHNDPLYWSRNRQDFITAREDDGTKGCQFETKEEAEKELIKAQKEWRKYNNEKSCAISEIEVVV